MTPYQLDHHYGTLIEKRPGATSLFATMSLKMEDFKKLHSITKKKVLINLTTVR
jgi:hypothetical protein